MDRHEEPSRRFSLHFFLVLAAALFPSSADASAVNKPKKIMGITGETVILPCVIPYSDGLPTVEWSKEGQYIALLYRDGCETFEMKHADFQFRTNLPLNELKRGNFSLKISNLRPSDEGKYECVLLQEKKRQVFSTLELVVGAVPEPKLSVVRDEDGGLTLQCEVKSYWPSQPALMFLDDQGAEISADKPKPVPHSGEFSRIVRRVPAANKFNSSVTCRVHHSEINQIRETSIYIRENCMTPCTAAIIIAIAVTAVVCGLACVIAFLYRKYSGCEKRPLPVNSQGITIRTVATHRLVNQADPDGHAELLRENEKLKSVVQEKDDIIRKLTDELKDFRSRPIPVPQHSRSPIDSKSPPDGSNPVNRPPQDGSPKPAASTNSNGPKSDNLTPLSKDPKPAASRQGPPPGPQMGKSTHDSCPSLLTDNVRPSTSEEKHRGRSRSLSEPRPRQSGAKIPRRHTTSVIASNNRFSPLQELSEDAEPLI